MTNTIEPARQPWESFDAYRVRRAAQKRAIAMIIDGLNMPTRRPAVEGPAPMPTEMAYAVRLAVMEMSGQIRWVNP